MSVEHDLVDVTLIVLTSRNLETHLGGHCCTARPHQRYTLPYGAHMEYDAEEVHDWMTTDETLPVQSPFWAEAWVKCDASLEAAALTLRNVISQIRISDKDPPSFPQSALQLSETKPLPP